MPRRTKLNPSLTPVSIKVAVGKAGKKNKASKAGAIKKTVKPKVKKITVKKIKKVSPKTAKAKLAQTAKSKIKPAPKAKVQEKTKPKSDAEIVLESINQKPFSVKFQKDNKSVLTSQQNLAPADLHGQSRKQAMTGKISETEQNENVADEIYSTETDKAAESEAAAKKVMEKAVSSDNVDNEEPISKSRSLGLYRKIALSFIVLTIMLLAAIAYFSFVKVTIILTPKQEHISSNLIIDVFDQDKRSTVSQGEILGVVKQVEVEQSKTYLATDIEVISEEVIGTVILINNYNKNQPLVATTRLLSPDNKLFRIKNTVNVPAGSQLEVEVYADEPGQDMVIGATHFIIPGLWAGLQDQIYGESEESMKYSRRVKKYIQQVDIDQAVKDLKQSLLDKAETEVSESYENYDDVIYDIDNNSISQQVDGKVGDEVEEFSITMKTMVVVVAFMDDEIYNLAQQKLISVLPDDKQLLDFSKDDISYSLNNYNINQGTASLNINFTGKMIIKQGASIVDREKLTGMDQQQLSDYLTGLPEVANYEIKFYPSFIKKAPNLVDRIELRIKK